MSPAPLFQFSLLALGLLSYVALGIVYRIFFHPLSKFPGPRLAAATSWHRGYHYTFGKGQNIQERLEELHERYGTRDFTFSRCENTINEA